MYYHFCLFHYVFLLVEKLVIPRPCLVYYRGQRYLPRGFPMGDALEMCGGLQRECLWGPAISVLLPPDFQWICTSAWVFLCGCAPYF